MNTGQAYLVIVLMSLALTLGAMILARRQRRYSTLSIVAVCLVAAGIFYEGISVWSNYILMGLGALLAVIDIVSQRFRT